MAQNHKHYACATRFSLPADRFHTEWSFRVYMLPLRDFVPKWNSCPGTTGVNSRRGDSRRHDILWWYHVKKYRAMRANRSKLAPARKSPRPVSCKHPLNPERVIGSVHTPARPRCHSTLVAGHDRRQSDSDTVQVPEYTMVSESWLHVTFTFQNGFWPNKTGQICTSGTQNENAAAFCAGARILMLRHQVKLHCQSYSVSA